MGAGGVAAGLLLPQIRGRLGRNNTVLVGYASAPAPAWRCWRSRIIGSAPPWRCWCSASAGWAPAPSCRARRSLPRRPWVRSRALAIYQLSSNGGLVLGTFVWGWLGTRIGLPATLLAAAATRSCSACWCAISTSTRPSTAARGVADAGVPAPEDVAPGTAPGPRGNPRPHPGIAALPHRPGRAGGLPVGDGRGARRARAAPAR